MLRFAPPFRGRYIASTGGGVVENIARVGVTILTTCAAIVTHDGSATASVTITASANGQQTDQQHSGTATVGIVITASASGTATSGGTTHSGTATVAVGIETAASGNAFTVHSGTADCQVNLTASANGFVPTDFINTNTVLWWDAGRRIAYNSSNRVSSWQDRTDTGKYLSIQGGGSRPTYDSSGGNDSNPAVDLGTDTRLTASGVSNFNGENLHAFVVMKLDSASAYGRVFGIGTGSPRMEVQYLTDQNLQVFTNINSSQSNSRTYTTSSSLRENWHILEVSWNGTAWAAKMHTASTTNLSAGSGGSYSGDIYLTNSTLEIGRETTTGNALDAHVADILLYDSVQSGATYTSILSHLREKHGFSSSTTHTGTATASVAITASASGSAYTVHSGTASCQVNLSASASGSVTTPFSNTYSINLAGDDETVDVSNFEPTSEIGTGDLTVSIWAKTDSTGNQVVWSWIDGGTADDGRMSLHTNTYSGQQRFRLTFRKASGAYTHVYSDSSLTVATGTWYNIIVTRSGTTANIYVNNAYNDSLTNTNVGTNFSTGTAEHWIGQYKASYASVNFDGKVDEYAIWNRVLTSTERASVYNSGTPSDLASDVSSGLVGWWRFEDNTVSGSGGSVTDSSTNSNTATLENGVTFSTDVPTTWQNTYSIDLDGTNDYVAVSGFNSNSLIGTGDMTAALWVQFDTLDGNMHILYAGQASANSDYLNIRYNNSANKIEARMRVGSVTDAVIDWDTAPSTGTWYHVAITRTGTTAILYVNGTQRDTITSAGAATPLGTSSSSTMRWGTWRSGAGYLEGHLDEIAIWDEVLTASEITAIYNSGAPTDLTTNAGNYTSSTGLIGYWRFEENTGTSIADSSTNSNTATLTNGPTFSTDTP